MLRAESKNGTSECWVLKCDVRKFFDSVDHSVLLGVLKRRVGDDDAFGLLTKLWRATRLPRAREFPIGNLTSQMFANIYMGEFDHFIKHSLHVKRYARYTDDFVVISTTKRTLELAAANARVSWREIETEVASAKSHNTKIPPRRGLSLDMWFFRTTWPSGRAQKRECSENDRSRCGSIDSGAISKAAFEGALSSYLGVLSHADAHELTERFRNQFGFESMKL